MRWRAADGYAVTRADGLSHQGRDLTATAPEERAREGVFLAFHPVESQAS